MPKVDLTIDELVCLDYQLEKDIKRHFLNSRGIRTKEMEMLESIKDKINNYEE